MFEKGEICIVNEVGAAYFNGYAKNSGGSEIKAGEKVVCREVSTAPYCTPLKILNAGDGEYTTQKAGVCLNTWALNCDDMQSTGEFMELD